MKKALKRAIALLLFGAMVFLLAACGVTGSASGTQPGASSDAPESHGATDAGTPSSPENPGDAAESGAEPAGSGAKVLVAYFSATGNTKKIAEYAADAMDAALYEIVPAVPYSADDLNYNNSSCRANVEMSDPSSRPAISGSVANMTDYDIVFIGYPIWWGETPRIISTFMESYDFAGKTVVTFSTSGSSGHSDSNIKALASGADWVTGTRLASNALQSEVGEWIRSLALDIQVEP